MEAPVSAHDSRQAFRAFCPYLREVGSCRNFAKIL